MKEIMILKKHLALPLAGLLLCSALSGCTGYASQPEDGTITIAATTYPVYLLASAVAEGADNITVVPVVNQSVACLHDYTLTVSDMKTLEKADLVLLSGAGLEDFMDDALMGKPTIDCSVGISLLESDEEEGEPDPHIWLDPRRAAQMTRNIAAGLAELDPDQAARYTENGDQEAASLLSLWAQGVEELSQLSCRQLITFHEGFSYFADAFDLDIVAAIEEESGSEASAKEIVEMVSLIDTYQLPAIFVEQNGSDATAKAIQRECGVTLSSLSMMMSGPEEYSETNCYETYLRQNLDTIKEVLE
jgi:ABC-type Zn uptake system ZnuABC Zn-binding protein ZnuA